MVGGKFSLPWPGFKLNCSLALLLANPMQVACCKNEHLLACSCAVELVFKTVLLQTKAKNHHKEPFVSQPYTKRCSDLQPDLAAGAVVMGEMGAALQLLG